MRGLFRSLFLAAAFAAVLLLVVPSSSFSEQRRVAAVISSHIKPYQDALEGFRKSCGCTIIEIPLGENSPAADRIRRAGVDAVLAIGLDALRGIESIRDIPVIYAMVPSAQFVPDRQNVSGVTMAISPSRQIEEIRRLFPSIKTIGAIYDPDSTEMALRDLRQAARVQGIVLAAAAVKRPSEIPAALDGVLKDADLFLMLPDPLYASQEAVDYLLLHSLRYAIPTFTFTKKYVAAGAVAAITIDPEDIGIQAGDILRLERWRGAPVRQQARKALLVINRKIAQKLKITISEENLRRADVVD